MANDFLKKMLQSSQKIWLLGFWGRCIRIWYCFFDVQNGGSKMAPIFARKNAFFSPKIKIKHFSKPYATNLESLISNLKSVFQKTKWWVQYGGRFFEKWSNLHKKCVREFLWSLSKNLILVFRYTEKKTMNFFIEMAPMTVFAESNEKAIL